MIRSIVQLLLCFLIGISARVAMATCSNGDPDICCQSPGAPNPVFNQACAAGTTAVYDVSGASLTNAKQVAATYQHVVFTADTVSAPVTNSVYWSDLGGIACTTPTLPHIVSASDNNTELDALGIDSTSSHVYANLSSAIDLTGTVLPSNTSFDPTLLATVVTNENMPAASPLGHSFAWADAGDIYVCISDSVIEDFDFECTEDDIKIRITNTTDVEAYPRIFEDRVTWENTTTGRVWWADVLDNPPTLHLVGIGGRPDTDGNWIVYERIERKPVAGCSWLTHTQLSAHGPLDDTSPHTARMQSTTYWGAADYVRPRIFGNYVVFLVNYNTMYFGAHSVVGIFPIASFFTTAPLKQLDDDADGYSTAKTLAGYSYNATKLRTAYTVYSTQDIRSKCCTISTPW